MYIHVVEGLRTVDRHTLKIKIHKIYAFVVRIQRQTSLEATVDSISTSDFLMSDLGSISADILDDFSFSSFLPESESNMQMHDSIVLIKTEGEAIPKTLDELVDWLDIENSTTTHFQNGRQCTTYGPEEKWPI